MAEWALADAVLVFVRYRVVMLALWASPLLAFRKPEVIRLGKPVRLADLTVSVVP